MKLTLSVIKADIGSIGGHIAPSTRLLETVRRAVDPRACVSARSETPFNVG
jgi:fructose 1,6-bisphosphate aldolase/phosphatase